MNRSDSATSRQVLAGKPQHDVALDVHAGLDAGRHRLQHALRPDPLLDPLEHGGEPLSGEYDRLRQPAAKSNGAISVSIASERVPLGSCQVKSRPALDDRFAELLDPRLLDDSRQVVEVEILDLILLLIIRSIRPSRFSTERTFQRVVHISGLLQNVH